MSPLVISLISEFRILGAISHRVTYDGLSIYTDTEVYVLKGWPYCPAVAFQARALQLLIDEPALVALGTYPLAPINIEAATARSLAGGFIKDSEMIADLWLASSSAWPVQRSIIKKNRYAQQHEYRWRGLLEDLYNCCGFKIDSVSNGHLSLSGINRQRLKSNRGLLKMLHDYQAERGMNEFSLAQLRSYVHKTGSIVL